MLNILLKEDIKREKVSETFPTTLGISIKNVSKKYADKIIFDDISVSVEAGNRVLLTGASGSGKSTLFHILTGDDRDYDGEICFLDGHGKKYAPSHDLVSAIHQKPYILKGRYEQMYLFTKIITIMISERYCKGFNYGMNWVRILIIISMETIFQVDR